MGVAGHVDHGKSTLIHALTGIDPDRLPEEKRRGMTLDLGFAHQVLDERTVVGFVDVPGHSRYIHNMVSGVGSTHAVLLVVAADDGIMPQTREHLEIFSLLGARTGLVVVTKRDLVDEETVELAQGEIAELLESTFLAGARILPVCARTGQGMPDLVDALRGLAQSVQQNNPNNELRLCVDRHFTLRGLGTVIAGTILSGTITQGAEVELYPLGKTVRVRSIQVYGAPVEYAVAGQRAALTVSGVEVQEVDRGVQVSVPGRYRSVTSWTASIHVPASSQYPLKTRGNYLVYHGAGEHKARVTIRGKRHLNPGENGTIDVQLTSAALALPGDRFLIRNASPSATLAGGIVRNTLAGHRSAKLLFSAIDEAAPSLKDQVLELAKRFPHTGVDEATLLASTFNTRSTVLAVVEQLAEAGLIERLSPHSCNLLDALAFRRYCEGVVQHVAAFHKEFPGLPGMAREQLKSTAMPDVTRAVYDAVLASLAVRDAIALEGTLVRLSTWKPHNEEEDHRVKQSLEEAVRSCGWLGMRWSELLQCGPGDMARCLQGLLKERRLVRVSPERVYHASVIEQLLALLQERKQKTDLFDIQHFKEITGTSRAQAIPLLEYCDRLGVTRRDGTTRRIK